jgi:glycerophosphoryl diester phosphodiesterase
VNTSPADHGGAGKTAAGGGVSVIAHRGASRAERENTIDAFRRARDFGADAVELDVRITADGELIVHHDAHVSDLGAINSLRRSELPSHIPLLSDALDACEDMWVNIEIKNDPREPDFDSTDQVARLVAQHLDDRRADDRWLISSFRLQTVDVMRALMPAIRTAWLTVGVPDDRLDAVARSLSRAGHFAIHPWEATLTQRAVEVFRSHQLMVNTWTCDDASQMETFREWGVQGVCTNVPDVAVSVLRGSRSH